MISLFFIGFLLLTFLWNLYYALHWSKNLSVSLDFVQNFVYAGDQAEMTEQIENRKRLVLPVLEVAFHMDKRLSFQDCENTNVSDYIYKRDIFALLGFQRVTRKLALNCPKRGYYQINSSDLTTFSMLHRRRFSIESPAKAALYVYAARTNITDIVIVCQKLTGNLQCAKRLYEDPFAFSSIREYTTADPMNTINWKASARTGELMVNTFESTLTEQVMIYLDLEDSGILKYEYLIEDSISVAASLVQKLINQGLEVGICINLCNEKNYLDSGSLPKHSGKNLPSIINIEPACSKRHLTRIEQTLAKCRNDDEIIPLAAVLAESSCLTLPQDAVMIFISKNITLNQAAIEKFVGRENQALWVVPYTRNETCDIKKSNRIQVIKREVDID